MRTGPASSAAAARRRQRLRELLSWVAVSAVTFAVVMLLVLLLG